MDRSPVEEAIEAFLEVKRKVVKGDGELGSKLRTRSREVPELMLELGLVPALSFCLAKAGMEALRRVVSEVEGCELAAAREGGEEGKEKKEKKEELSYAAYAYVVLRYLRGYAKAGSVCDLVREEDRLYELLGSMVGGAIGPPAYGLLLQYLQQFKRLCEAAFERESGR